MRIFSLIFLLCFTTIMAIGCDQSESSIPALNSNITNKPLNINKVNSETDSRSNTATVCRTDDTMTIYMSYPKDLSLLNIRGYSRFNQYKIEKIEISENRPYQFIHYYKNDDGYKSILTSQGVTQYLEVYDRSGSKKSYEFSSGLECQTHKNYKVNIEKAFIYKTPSIKSKSSAYFIKGDIIEPLSKRGDWIQVSYKNGTKTGWLHLSNLIKSSLIEDKTNKSPLIQNSIDNKTKQLSKHGFQNIHINDEYDKALFPEILNSSNPDIHGCFFAKIEPYLEESVKLFVYNNKIKGITVSNTEIRSNKNVSVGDSIESVFAKHENEEPEIINGNYSKQPIIIYMNNDGSNIGTRYDIEDGLVYEITLGDGDILKLQEGCS